MEMKALVFCFCAQKEFPGILARKMEKTKNFGKANSSRCRRLGLPRKHIVARAVLRQIIQRVGALEDQHR